MAQDGHNGPAAQNFKLVAWDDIKAALGRAEYFNEKAENKKAENKKGRK